MLSGVLLQNNFQRSCWGNESVQNREGGGLYYLVASAVGPNYSYAFLTVSQRHKTFFIAITHFASRHCHTSRRTYWAGRWAWKACAAGTQTCWRPISKTSSQTPKMTKKSSTRRKQTADWSTHRPRSCFSLTGSRKAEKKVMRLFYILMRPNLSEQLRRSCINSARALGSENLSELQYWKEKRLNWYPRVCLLDRMTLTGSLSCLLHVSHKTAETASHAAQSSSHSSCTRTCIHTRTPENFQLSNLSILTDEYCVCVRQWSCDVLPDSCSRAQSSQDQDHVLFL